ncbi:MAG TPA: glycosyltransferase family 4 protein [Vicinamibacterales bacterium]|nr:glycosyltransferase family 4 protein [Vicinamibacterales bacterium]
MIVHQWVPSAHQGDAVGDQARRLRDLCRGWGHESEIFAIHVDRALESDIYSWEEPEARDADVTILHFATASPMSAAFGRLPGARILAYHNVTPARFFAPYDAGMARTSAVARQELAALAGRVDLATGASAFSCAELDELGFAETRVLPILVDIERLRRAPPVPALDRLLQDDFVNILFVGRIAPQKRIDHHVHLAQHYMRYVDAYYRFIFVGRYDVVPGYFEAVQAMVQTFRIPADRFWFTGAVPEDELAAYYRHAHAYVSLSEHEGFCVPLVEAMSMDVPVLAYAGTAVPETLGGAGVSFRPKDLEMAAELLGGLIYDEPFRQGVLAGQRARVRDFDRRRIEPAFLKILETVGS